MDEHPLGKISRQLSELAAVTNVAGQATDASPDLGGQWTQFSGISAQTGQTPFRNLCTWNSLDLPDFNTLPQTLKTNTDSNQSHFGADSGVFSGCSDFLNQNQFDWHRGSSSHQKFQVTGDLAGRLLDVSRVHSCSFDQPSHSPSLKQDNFQPSNHVFHYHGIGSGSNVPIHQQMSPPSTPSPFASPDRSSRQSLSNASTMSLLSNTGMSENLLQDDMTFVDNAIHEGLTHGISVNSLSHVHLLQSPPVFDPSTPPPLFPIERHIPENFQPNHFSNASNNDPLNYLQMQEKMSINFDLGTTISKTAHSPFSNQGSPHINAEGTRMYAKKQWHSFDSNTMLSSEHLQSQTPPHIQEFLSERAISADSSKPSYSDIAKTPRNGPAFGAKIDKFNIDGNFRNVPLKLAKKDEKQSQPVAKKASTSSIWLRSCQSGESDQSSMAPTSRYGLDSFDDQLLVSGNHSSSSESLANIIKNRRGSDSSMSNPVGVVGDIASQGATDSISSENYVFGQVQGSSVTAQQQPFMSTNPAKPPMSSKPPNSSVLPDMKESLFFDPRRIFQTKSTNKYQSSSSSKSKGVSNVGLDDFGAASLSGTILNNGKPTVSTTSSKLSSSARQHDYINNDLRDASKLTNQTAAGSSQGTNGGKTDDQHKQKESRVGKKYGGRASSIHLRNKRSTSDGDKAVDETHEDNTNSHHEEPGFWPDIDREKIEEWCYLVWDKLFLWGNIFVTSVLKLLVYMLGIIICFASVTIHLFVLLIGKSWTLIKSKLIRGYFDTPEGTTRTSHDHLRRYVGLEENINLPATGDEAMKRLLACKGKDPYSILGLRADSTDEDIKKYYRKQAVLVHPDKNQELGAEEAFKILGHAFEMIGEPAKRRQYDSHNQETTEAEAMREFAEMLSKLQTKIQEAANIMHCDNCGGKHRRMPVERPFYSARFCQRCNTRHSAKEGDVWAESTMLGFYWHYFALMEGHVYNITEWMKCHKEYFSHMKANSHAVQYKIATDGNRKNKHHQQGEPNLEDFINRLFKSSTAAEGQRTSWGASQPGTQNSWAQEGATAAAAAKKNRRKKKRH